MTLLKLSSYLSILLLIITGAQDCTVVEWDYEQNPKLTYNLNHLDLDMTIDPANETVKGVATYSISAKIPAQTEVLLHAAAIEIDAVTFDGTEKEFLISGDSLIIDLADTLSMTNESELAITWQGRSIYGTHKDRFGTMWSSLNPKSQRHWLPVYDHPRVAFSVDADITVPANLDVVFNGNLVSDQVTSTETKTVSWKADTAIPATGLNFAVGKFESAEAQSGINKVRVFGETGVVSGDEVQEILSEAIRSKRILENELSFEYPWEALNLVILEDNFWDEKTDAAGVIYLAKNRGALTTQLQRGLVAQWFGQYQRTENVTSQYEVFELIRKSAFNIAGFESKEIWNSDSLFSLSIWNQLSKCCEIEDSFLKNNVEQSLAELIKKESGVVSGSFYKDHWYEQTGVPFHLIGFEADEESETSDSQKPIYELSLEYDEINSTATAIFSSLSGNGEDLQSLDMTFFTFDDSTTSEITFTGERDSSKIAVPVNVEYIRFGSGSTNIDEVTLVRFPVMFLLAQLRSSNVKDRRIAAHLLSYHTDNPDLQLALKDALDAEADIQTKANLLSTLGAFTAGATGTEIQFMQEMNNDNELLQIAALEALSKYKEDENVPGVIQQKMERTSSDEVFKVAKTSFLEVADLPRKISATRRLIQIDTTGARSLSLLMEIFSTDTTNQSQQIAEELLSFDFPYSTRIAALNILLENVESPEYWGSKIVELSNDFDPRIRLKVLDGLNFLSETDAENIVDAVLLSEFDPRVLMGGEEL